MATFAELKTNVNELVIDTPSVVQTMVPKFVNRAIRDLQRRNNFEVMKYTLEATTGADNTLVALPSDWKDFREAAYFTEFQGGIHEISTTQDISWAKRRWNITSTAHPDVLLIGEPTDDDGTRNILVYPTPDGLSDYSDGHYRVTIPYWRYLPDLSADGDSNWFSVNCDDFIEYRATSFAFEAAEDAIRADRWAARAADCYQTINHAKSVSALNTLGGTLPFRTGARGPKYSR